MRIKIPALTLLCAAAGFLLPSGLNAGDDKKPAETKKSAQAKKSEPGKKPESKKRKSTRREAVEAELKMLRDQLAENGKELGKSRESLHTAQKELATKAQTIKSLEAKKCAHEAALKKANEELKKYKSSDFNKLAHTLDAERKKNAALQSQLKETQQKAHEAIAKAHVAAAQRPTPSKSEPKKPEPKKPEPKKSEPKKSEPKKSEPKKPEPKKSEPKKSEPKKPEPKKPEPKKPEPKKTTQSQNQASAVAPVYYDMNSAVNYKERDRVLRQVRAILKKSPKAQLQITGYADDTPYKEANNEVGANRAKFLVKYLSLNGVPEKQLSNRGIGSPRQGKGDGNRKVVIQIRN